MGSRNTLSPLRILNFQIMDELGALVPGNQLIISN